MPAPREDAMAINMQGSWTVRVKSKSAAFAQRFVISGASSGNGTYAGNTGTPAVADPGARLAREARDHGIAVVPVPGPSAITAALSVAGLPVNEFTFMGFPPAGGSERRAWLERLGTERRATVFFEAPHRIHRTLADAQAYCGIRPIYVFRELSKINEELVITPIKSINSIKAKGEFVLLAAPMSPSRQAGEPPTVDVVVLVDRAKPLCCLQVATRHQ
jgi:16S rRNA (cytidine1402-2'-O)-methyltransferase